MHGPWIELGLSPTSVGLIGLVRNPLQKTVTSPTTKDKSIGGLTQDPINGGHHAHHPALPDLYRRHIILPLRAVLRHSVVLVASSQISRHRYSPRLLYRWTILSLIRWRIRGWISS